MLNHCDGARTSSGPTSNGRSHSSLPGFPRGAELDFVLVRGGVPAIGIEVKLSTSPSVTSGFHGSIDDLGLSRAYVVTPGDLAPYSISPSSEVIGLTALMGLLRSRVSQPD